MKKALVRKNDGQTLIELLMALGAGVLIIVAIIGGVVTAGRNSQFAKNQNLATNLAQEGIELVRSQRDKLGWSGFSDAYTVSPVQCIDSNGNFTSGVPNCPPNAGTANFFTRTATFTVSGFGLDVTVTVSWQDSNGVHKSSQTTFLSSWE